MKKILVFGASNIALLEPFLTSDFYCQSYPGFTSLELLHEYACFDLSKYQAVVLSVGTNDTGSLIPHQSMLNISALLSRTNIPVLILETPNNSLINDQFKDIVKTIAFPKLTSDGIHLTSFGAIIVAEEIMSSFYV
jgi:alanine-alpha-ketoisovalerate/valine-pyruvate aminotransferase